MGEVNNAFVVLLGMGTVFFGLICIVILCTIMSKICQAVEGKKKAPESNAVPAAAEPAPQPAEAEPVAAQAVPETYEIPNRQEIIAAVSAAIAEDLGTDISNIRVLSFRQTSAPATQFIPNRGEIIAAVTAAIAEDLGTDVSNLRVLSFKPV